LPAAADAALRNGFSRFHEPHSVIRLTRVRSYPGNAVVTVRDEAPVRRGPNSYDFEAQAWASIVAPLHTDLLPDAGPARDGILLELPEPRADLALRAEWRELSAVRRSAKRFGAEPLTGARLAATVGALATPLPTTFGPDPADRLPADRSAVSATVIVNDRLQLSPAEHRSITRCARLVRYPTGSDSAPVEVGSFIAACMGQPHVGHGQAFVLLHARAELVAEGLTGHHLRQALFRAGAGAQLLCLAATRDRIAASTIGGFDSAVWARIGQLPEDTELLYLLVLGAPEAESGPARADRGEKATAHGES
ncbi:MAG TPA: nitroreductase family protein, partial [Jatrophihabitans sp.]|nr:nitroreductase family protein [Jatrophihabitans sp.]